MDLEGNRAICVCMSHDKLDRRMHHRLGTCPSFYTKPFAGKDTVHTPRNVDTRRSVVPSK